MSNSDEALARKRCVPCEGGVPPLGPEEVARLASEVPEWSVADGKLTRRLRRDSFPEVIELVGAIAEVAEAEGHHPDLHVHFDVLDVEIWTHALGEDGGLSENDFILAAKIDEVASRAASGG